MNFVEFFDTQAIAMWWSQTQPDTNPYIGPSLFPARKKAGLDLAWLKGSRGLAVSLKPSAFDAKATFRDRIGFDKIETEMPFFREGFHIGEKDRQELLRVQESGDPYAQAIIERVFDDSNELIAGANVVPERMIHQLLFPVDGNAGVSIRANDVDYTYDYDVDGKWKTKNYTELTKKWSEGKTADPFKDFKTVKDAALANTGTILTKALMNMTTFNMLMDSDAVKNRFLTSVGVSVATLGEQQVKDIFRQISGIDIIIRGNMYRDEDKVMHQFVPDNYVSLIPDGTLGSTWYGTTPEEADLAASNAADVTIVNTGVAISRIIEPHPVNINIYASEIVLPSFERMDDVHVLKVA